MKTKRVGILGGLVLQVLFACGCSPIGMGVQLGVKVVGEVVNDADVKDRQGNLIGRPTAAADEMFGQRLDAFQEVNGPRQWLTYPVDLDVLDKYRYVVEVSDNKIVSLTKASKGGSKIDIPRRLILKQKVKGKRPKECQAELGLGPPLLTVRSKMTKRLVQLFDAKIIDIPGDPQYCLLRYDDQDRCEDLEFQEAEASTKKDPLSN